MSRPSRTAPAATVAGCGLCAVIAAVAFAGWDPGQRMARAWAAHSHRSSTCTRAESRGRREHSRERPDVHAGGRGRAAERCPEASRHAAKPKAKPGPEGSTGATGSSGGVGASSSPGPTTAPPPGQSGAGETSTPPPSLPEVQVSAVEYHFTLSRTTVPAGKVIIQFVNDGQDEHNLNAQGESGPQAATFATEDPKAVTRQVVELRPGSYTLFCSLPGHEAKGMKATLTVE
jgi:plastocyanin